MTRPSGARCASRFADGPGVRARRRLEDRAELVRFELVRADDAEVALARAPPHHLGQVGADLLERARVEGAAAARLGTAAIPASGRSSGLRSAPPFAWRFIPMPRVAARREGRDVGRGAALGVEELLGAVRAEPRLEDGEVRRVRLHVGGRHLVRAERALDRLAVNRLRTGPPFGRTEHDHRPARFGTTPPARCPRLDGSDAIRRLVERRRHPLVDAVVVARDDERLPAVAAVKRGAAPRRSSIRRS